MCVVIAESIHLIFLWHQARCGQMRACVPGQETLPKCNQPEQSSEAVERGAATTRNSMLP
jgi:hypothetical protein